MYQFLCAACILVECMTDSAEILLDFEKKFRDNLTASTEIPLETQFV